jgi:3'-phosphoadenosine 5'-phosphosulfate (PAPS) 3'-phosphatase
MVHGDIVFFHTLHACIKDLVTEVDEASEKLILNGLKKSFPHHEFVGEVNEHAQWLQAEVQCPQALRHKHRMTLCTHICVCVCISSHGVYAASRDASKFCFLVCPKVSAFQCCLAPTRSTNILPLGQL